MADDSRSANRPVAETREAAMNDHERNRLPIDKRTAAVLKAKGFTISTTTKPPRSMAR
jgi:hypothetical protein